jgi:hypothetical protein
VAVMSLKVRLSKRAIAEIRGWHLPDRVLQEVYLYLREVLPADPENNRHRDSEPFDRARGLTCAFSRRDHRVRGRDHHFIFHLFFSQDEEALIIERGVYRRENGP